LVTVPLIVNTSRTHYLSTYQTMSLYAMDSDRKNREQDYANKETQTLNNNNDNNNNNNNNKNNKITTRWAGQSPT